MTDQTLYPNVYRIRYEQIEEGNVVERITYLEDIDLLLHYKDMITEITPIHAQFLPELSIEGIAMLIHAIEQKNIASQSKADIEQQINDAEEALLKLKNML